MPGTHQKTEIEQTAVVPNCCPFCGAEWRGGHAKVGQPLTVGYGVFYMCGASLVLEKMTHGDCFLNVRNCGTEPAGQTLRVPCGVDRCEDMAEYHFHLGPKQYLHVCDDHFKSICCRTWSSIIQASKVFKGRPVITGEDRGPLYKDSCSRQGGEDADQRS